MPKIKITFKTFAATLLFTFNVAPLSTLAQSVSNEPPWGTNTNVLIPSDTIFTEDITINTPTTFNIEDGKKLILSGNVSTQYDIPLNFIIKQGQGLLELNGNNNGFESFMALEAGTIHVSGQSALGLHWQTLTQHLGTTLSFAPNSLIHNHINVHPATSYSPTPGTNYTGIVWHVGHGSASYVGTLSHDDSIDTPTPLIKTGAGTLKLGGKLVGNKHRIDIAKGTLQILRSTLVPGTVTALDGTLLTGEGIANNVVINSGATFAPTGKFTVLQNARMDSGSRFLVRAWNDGTSDSLHSRQTAELAGTVIAIPQGNPSDWLGKPQYSYEIVNTANGLNNSRFDAVESAVPYLQAKIDYTANNAILVLSPALVTESVSSTSPKQNPVTSNCNFGALVAHTILDSRLVRDAANSSRETGFWAQGLHSSADMRNLCTTGSGQKQTTGLIGGTGIKVKNGWHFGLMAGVTNTSIYAHSPHRFNSKILTHHIGLHTNKNTNWINLSMGAAFSHHKIQNNRTATAPLLQHRAYSNAKAHTKQLFIHASGKHNGKTSIVPFASAAWVSYKQGKTTENGGLLALQTNKYKQNNLFTTLGFNAQHNVDLKQGSALLELEAGWMHTHGKRNSNLKQHYRYDKLQTQIMNSSKAIPRSLWALKLGMQAQANRNTDINIYYSGMYGKGLQDHGVRLTLNIGW